MNKSCVAVRHVAFEDLGLLGPLIAARGYDIAYHDAGIEPFDVDALVRPDLVIVLGGPIGVYQAEAYPFISAEIAAVAARLRSGEPMLGVCLGAQMMAAALGARVVPGPVKEICFAPLTLTEAGKRSVLSPLGNVPVLHWHGDNCELPADCSLLASTPPCPVQAFLRTPTQLALQFHLEIEPERFEAWLVGHTIELRESGIDPRKLRQQACALGPALRDVGRRVLSAWLDAVAGAAA